MSEPIQVFVIDDHEIFLDAIKQFAKLPNNQDIKIVGTARTEGESFNLVSKLKPDVVLIDMTLAGDREAGLRIIKALFQEPNHPKLLAISGTISSPEFIIRVLRNHAAGFLLKDTKGLNDVFEAIRNVYRGGKEIPLNVAEYTIGNNPTWTRLTPREQDTWESIAEGLSNQTIADKFGISIDAVKHYTTVLYSKIGVENRAQATRKWMEEQYGLIDIPPFGDRLDKP